GLGGAGMIAVATCADSSFLELQRQGDKETGRQGDWSVPPSFVIRLMRVCAISLSPCLPVSLSHPRYRVILLSAVALFITACQQQMGNHGGYKPLTKSDFFEDGRSARPFVKGTVARGQLQDDPVLFTGKDEEGNYSGKFPFEMTEAILKRGKGRYTIYCSV